jgi:single-stranded-DNA-specific exonuclease
VSSDAPGRVEPCVRPPTPRWEEPGRPDPGRIRALEAALRLPGPVCSVLVARGYDDPERAKRFLRPRLEHLGAAGLLAGGLEAAERIAGAVRSGETILVHGDYDVDGICATAVLTRWLRTIGGNVQAFVPHRLRDGYDFSAAGLAAARQAGATLVVTVDCGTVAHGTVSAAARDGIDVIVTDHHTVGGTLPEAVAVVNPNRPDCAFPEKALCGAGLAWRLAGLVTDVLQADPAGLHALLDLVALATIADMVPLTGENRVLTQQGLRRLVASEVAGLRALLRVADVDPATVSAGKIGFQLAPRINAAGRLGDSADALELLLTDDEERAAVLARRLDDLNAQRRAEDRRTFDEVVKRLESTFDPARDFGLVIEGEGWHPGVIGIVASNVAELVHRPVVMVALDGGKGRGSARSIPGFHLYDAIAACSAHLDRFGGHRQAAGMDIPADSVAAFREAFNAEARARLVDAELRPVLRPDLDVSLSDVDAQLAHWFGYLGPHGIGNAGPLLRACSVRLEHPRVVGSGHLKVQLADAGARVEAIGFGLADRFPPDRVREGSWDALFRLEKNEWRGRVQAQARLVDLRRAADWGLAS